MEKYWQQKEVLVTGAGGFIASHLIEALVQHGARVKAFVRYNSRADLGLLRYINTEANQKITIVAGDLRDLDALKDAVRNVSHVFHLGALIAIPYSYVHPVEVVESNVIGTLNVLLAAREVGVERVIHTSTSEVYGTAVKAPIAEDHPLQGQSPYSASKIGADKLAESFFRSFDLPVVTLRPFNTYGPRQSARAVIPTIISQALTANKIWLGNLTTKRDLTYVSDTVAGFLRAGEVFGIEGETFNLGTGREISIGELAELVTSMIGKPVQIMLDESRLRPEKSEVQRLLSDNSLAYEKLAWRPQVSLEVGLERTIQWISEHLDLYPGNKYQI